MLRTILAVSAIALAAPAVAQDSTSVEADVAVDAQQSTSVGADPAAEAQTSTAVQADMTTGAQVTAPSEGDPITIKGNPEQRAAADKAVPEVVATKADVTFAIDAEWRNFDRNADDKLDQTEFAWFMKKIRETAGNTAETSAEVGRLNAAAFAEADLDQSKFITRDEMIGLLRSPAA